VGAANTEVHLKVPAPALVESSDDALVVGVNHQVGVVEPQLLNRLHHEL
jgi:hypothetical protein